MFVVTLLQGSGIREALRHCQKSMSELLGKILKDTLKAFGDFKKQEAKVYEVMFFDI